MKGKIIKIELVEEELKELRAFFDKRELTPLEIKLILITMVCTIDTEKTIEMSTGKLIK